MRDNCGECFSRARSRILTCHDRDHSLGHRETRSRDVPWRARDLFLGLLGVVSTQPLPLLGEKSAVTESSRNFFLSVTIAARTSPNTIQAAPVIFRNSASIDVVSAHSVIRVWALSIAISRASIYIRRMRMFLNVSSPLLTDTRHVYITC